MFLIDNDKGMARGNDALTVLDFPETRNAFSNEIFEVKQFVLHCFM